MKILPLLWLATFSVVSIANADLSIVQSIDSNAGNRKVGLKIKGDRARIEVGPGSSMIVDSKSGDVITLMHDQKSFLRFNKEKTKKISDQIRARANEPDASLEIATPKPTGKTEKINGYETEEYSAETPKYKASYWVAKTYPDYQAILKQMKLLQNGIFSLVRKAMPEYYEFPGMPLRTKIKFPGQVEVTTTVASISQAPIPDSEFTVPADYSEVKLPEWQAGTPPPNVNPADLPGGPTPTSTP